MAARVPERMSYEEYLAFEEQSDEKHTFIDGEIFPVFDMSGGTPEHARLAMAFGGELRAALRGKPCVVYSSDLRVRLLDTKFSSYPDVSVICGKLQVDPADKLAAVNPVIVVEVLSPGTEILDRGKKAQHYRRIVSLREHVLVSQDEPRVEVYRRNESGRFELFEFGPGETIELASIGARIDVDAIYADPSSVESS